MNETLNSQSCWRSSCDKEPQKLKQLHVRFEEVLSGLSRCILIHEKVPDPWSSKVRSNPNRIRLVFLWKWNCFPKFRAAV